MALLDWAARCSAKRECLKLLLLGQALVGDHPHDVDFARGVGATGIYVLSGHGMKHRGELSEEAVVANGIAEAAEYILERTRLAES